MRLTTSTMKQKTLLLFIFSFAFVKVATSQSCYGNYPLYYAKNLVYIYQSQDSESAIIGEVPKGESVKVTNSFFGRATGFWEICYNGNTGWVKKGQLSYEKIQKKKPIRKVIGLTDDKPISNSNDEDEFDNQDVGFDPFLAKTISTVNFRNGPSSTYRRLKTLKGGTMMYVYSQKLINDYYKAIDITTSQIGWVNKKYIKYVKDVDINENGAFQSTGYSSSYDSEISITNKSSQTIKLIVDNETFTLGPKSTKKSNVKPGRKYYIATSPGVIPASGYQNFESNHGYDWAFWIEKK